MKTIILIALFLNTVAQADMCDFFMNKYLKATDRMILGINLRDMGQVKKAEKDRTEILFHIVDNCPTSKSKFFIKSHKETQSK